MSFVYNSTFSPVFLLDYVFSQMWFKDPRITSMVFSVAKLGDGNVSRSGFAADSSGVQPLEWSTSLFTWGLLNVSCYQNITLTSCQNVIPCSFCSPLRPSSVPILYHMNYQPLKV